MNVIGRRLPDSPMGELPDDIQAGDYWRELAKDGGPSSSDAQGNLTGTVWIVAIPMSYGYAIGRLSRHTVREDEDGAISVRPGDGSSNSVWAMGHHGETWHGYIERGAWSAV